MDPVIKLLLYGIPRVLNSADKVREEETQESIQSWWTSTLINRVSHICNSVCPELPRCK